MFLYILCVLLCSIETIIVSLCANKDIIIIIIINVHRWSTILYFFSIQGKYHLSWTQYKKYYMSSNSHKQKWSYLPNL